MFFYCISATDYGQRLNQDLPHNIQMQSVSTVVHFEPHNHQHSSKRAPDVERTRRQTSWVVAKTRTYGYYFIAGAGHPSPTPTNDWSTGGPNSRYKWLRAAVVTRKGCCKHLWVHRVPTQSVCVANCYFIACIAGAWK